MTFTEQELAYLAEQRLGRLATVATDGSPQNNPVGFQYNAATGTIDIGGRSLGATRKFRNIGANDSVALVVDDIVSIETWTVRGIEIRGRAEALTEQPRPNPYFSAELIRIHPELIFSWGINPEHEGMDRRTVGDRPIAEVAR